MKTIREIREQLRIMEVLASTSNDYRDRHTNKEMYEIFAYALQWVLNEEKK